MSTFGMSEEQVELLLRQFPGSRRAAVGVIVPMADDVEFHITSITRFVDELSHEEQLHLPYCSVAEIKRLRELRSGHDYLLRLRADAVAAEPRMIRVFQSRRRTDPTWSLTGYYHRLDHHKKNYLAHVSKPHRKRLINIPAGLAPIRQANASCIKSLLGEVIVVSEVLEHFLYFMNLAFLGENFEIPHQDRASALLIATRIMLGTEAPDFDLDPRGTLPIHIDRKLRDFCKDQMEFTFGHEYAHHLLGHVQDITSVGSSTPSGAEAVKYEHEMEFQADEHAVKHIATSDVYRTKLAVAATRLFVYLDFFYYVASSTASQNLLASDTHPSPLDRIWSLRRRLKTNIGMRSEHIEEMLALSNIYKELFLKFLTHQRDDILTFYGSIYLPTYKEKLQVDRRDF